MKKIMKKITALVLSLLMVLGCIPNFTNIVSANDITIADIIDTAPDGFPSSLDEAWQNEDGDKVFFSDSQLSFYSSNNPYVVEVELNSNTTNVTEKDNGYEFVDMMTTISFNMSNDELESITYSVFKGDLQGTYKPTIYYVDLISTGVLTTNINTLKFEVEDEDNANYILSDTPTDTWYSDPDCKNIIISKNPDDTVYRPIIVCPKNGYMIDKNANEATASVQTGLGATYTAEKDGDNLKVIVSATVIDNFTKSAAITLPITSGTTLEQIKNRISISTTETEGTATINKDSIKLSFADDLSSQKDDSYELEVDKDYLLKIEISDVEREAYSSVSVNNTDMSKGTMMDYNAENVFYIPFGPKLCVNYKFKAVQPAPISSGGSKKYKANDNDTAEKVSGSGKKGAKRTIVPEEGRRVKNVTVIDKNDKPVEVAMNEDGTYSFIQPASDVIINVEYEAKEIKMEVGTIGATIDGIGVNEYVTPKVKNNETMLPIRFIAENLGAKVEWNELEPNMVYITKGDKKIEIKLGSYVIKVNGEEITLNSAAFAEENRTYVPFDLIENALDATVKLEDDNSNGIVITEK